MPAADDQHGAEDAGRVVGLVREQGHPGHPGRGENPASEDQEAGAEARQEPLGGERPGRQQHGHGDDGHPGAQRAVTEDLLEVEGQEEKAAGHDHTQAGHDGVTHGQAALPEDAERDERGRAAGLDHSEGGQEDHGGGQGGDDGGRSPPLDGGLGDGVDQGAGPDGHGERAGQVEACPVTPGR